MQKYYEINKPPYTFHAIVAHHKDQGIWRIKFGGSKGCVMFSIYDDEDYPNLDGLAYGKECAVGPEGLLPGLGTVMMAQAAFGFVKHLFPTKRGIMLKDQSKITCAKNKVLSLQHFYLAKHMQTWYEAKFGAVLYDAKDKREYAKLRNILTSTYKSTMDDFLQTYVSNSMSEKQFESLKDILSTYYQSCTNYLDFLKNLAEDHDCIIFDKWLFKFLTSVSDFKFSDAFWVIDYKQVSAELHIKKTKTKPQFDYIVHGGAGDIEAQEPLDLV